MYKRNCRAAGASRKTKKPIAQVDDNIPELETSPHCQNKEEGSITTHAPALDGSKDGDGAGEGGLTPLTARTEDGGAADDTPPEGDTSLENFHHPTKTMTITRTMTMIY